MNCKLWNRTNWEGEQSEATLCTTEPLKIAFALGPLRISGRLVSLKVGRFRILAGIRAYDIMADRTITGFAIVPDQEPRWAAQGRYRRFSQGEYSK